MSKFKVQRKSEAQKFWVLDFDIHLTFGIGKLFNDSLPFISDE